MSANVPHSRPEQGSFDDMLSGEPVSATDWSTLAALANWLNGRGGQCIPWCSVGHEIAASGTVTLSFRHASKAQTVARIWNIHMLSDTDGATATIVINGVNKGTVIPPRTRGERRAAFAFVDELSSQTGDLVTSTVAIQATGGAITVETLAAYDDARRVLARDSTDYGVDVTTLRARQPVAAFANASVKGVCDAEKSLSSRRLGHYAWSVPTSAAISPGSTSLTALTEVPITIQSARDGTNTTEPHAVRVYAKVSSGTGKVSAVSAQGGHSTTMSITRTSFGWDSADLLVETEDLTTSTGRRSGEETVTFSAADPAGQTLSIAAILVIRSGSDKV